MDKAIKVNHYENGIEKILTSIEGLVIFSETKPTGYGSCLNVFIKSDEGLADIRWQNSPNNADIRVGDRIRGFYRNKEMNIIYMEAYEILNDKNEVLTRARKEGYRFIDPE